MTERAAVPSWMVKAVLTAIVGAIITVAVAWGRTLSSGSHTHDTRISVVEEHVKHIDKTLDEIKTTQQRMEDKLDRALERR